MFKKELELLNVEIQFNKDFRTLIECFYAFRLNKNQQQMFENLFVKDAKFKINESNFETKLCNFISQTNESVQNYVRIAYNIYSFCLNESFFYI